MVVTFNKGVANPDQPQGRVAQRLREIVISSNIRSSEELKRSSNYAGSTLSEAMGGRKRQNRSIITGIVQACIPDRSRAEEVIEELVAVLEESTEAPDSDAGPVVERRPDPAVLNQGSPSATGSVEKPLDEDDDPGIEINEVDDPSPPTRAGGGSGGSHEPPPGPAPSPPSPPSPRRWRRWVVALVALVVIAAGGYGVYTATRPTYVSDGSVNVAADPAFDTVFGKIKAENDRVLGAPDHAPVVSVSYTAPFPAEHGALSDQLRRELEGAYEMQLQRNEAGGSNPLGGPPRVQLLIANLGNQAADEATVVGQLQDRADPSSPAPLVAVIGLDQSLPGVEAAVDGLGRAGIPMVAGRLVADSFGVDAVNKGFFAVAPPVHDQVAAAARYLSGRASRPLLVEDTTNTDLYGRDVADQFKTQFAAASKAGPLPPPVPFNSSLPGLQTAFAGVLPAVCTLKPDVVFYAGRGTNLADFVRELGVRPCPQVPVTVFTLSDGRQLANAVAAENASGSEIEHQLNAAMTDAPGVSGVRVLLTAQAHPAVWSNQQLEPLQSHAVLNGQFATAFPQQFPDEQVVDDGGDVIMGHDAMQVVVEAIVRSRPAQSSDPVTDGLVRQALGSITPYAPINSASGPIAYTEAGFPVGKNIPVTEISAFGQIIVRSPTTPQ